MTDDQTLLPLTWSCSCRMPPLVLARFNIRGIVELEHHERYWLVGDRLATNCPGCGKQHRLELSLDAAVQVAFLDEWQSGHAVAETKNDRP